MIELVKTTFKCGHMKYHGSMFGNTPQVAEQNAREAGFLVEETSEEVCPLCEFRKNVPVV